MVQGQSAARGAPSLPFLFALGAASVLSGCPSPPATSPDAAVPLDAAPAAPPVIDGSLTGTWDAAGVETGSARSPPGLDDSGIADRGPSDAPTVLLSIPSAGSLDGGARALRLSGTDVTATPRGAAAPVEVPVLPILELTISEPLEDFRVRLLDAQEALVPSDDTATPIPDGGWRYLLKPVRLLTAGRTYFVVVDAQHGARVRDVNGREYEDLRSELSPAEPRLEAAPSSGPAPTRETLTKSATKAKAKKPKKRARRAH